MKSFNGMTGLDVASGWVDLVWNHNYRSDLSLILQLLPTEKRGTSFNRGISHHGTRIHACQVESGNESKGVHVTFDCSPYSVKRERFRLNEPHSTVQVDILEPDTSRMALLFEQTNNVVLPCVRTRTGEFTLFPFQNKYADEEHIVFVKVRATYPTIIQPLTIEANGGLFLNFLRNMDDVESGIKYINDYRYSALFLMINSRGL